MLARSLQFIPTILSTGRNKENRNFNIRLRPHLDKNITKNLEDHSRFNRARATKFSCHFLNNHFHRPTAVPLSNSILSLSTSASTVISDIMSSFLAFTRFLLIYNFYLFRGPKAHDFYYFMKPVNMSHDVLFVFSASMDNHELYISYSNSPVEKTFTVQFITAKNNHQHPSRELLLHQATTTQMSASVQITTPCPVSYSQDLESKFCLGTG